MPEGPTIRHTADLLRDALEGQQITRFHSPLKKADAPAETTRRAVVSPPHAYVFQSRSSTAQSVSP
jgi:hypothetical protein